jgi:hypothetical protein
MLGDSSIKILSSQNVVNNKLLNPAGASSRLIVHIQTNVSMYMLRSEIMGTFEGQNLKYSYAYKKF